MFCRSPYREPSCSFCLLSFRPNYFYFLPVLPLLTALLYPEKMISAKLKKTVESYIFCYCRHLNKQPAAEKTRRRSWTIFRNKIFLIRSRVIEDICVLARRNKIQKVILFESRARNTHTPTSDIDLAVAGGKPRSFHWDLEEEARTLCKFDVVDLSHANEVFTREIERDGVILYEEI